MYRLFLAQQRVADQLPAVAALLERWLGGAAALPAPRGEESPRCSTGSSSPPSCATRPSGDLARGVRYRYFEEPVVRPPASEVYRGGRGPAGRARRDPRHRRDRGAADRGAGREPGAADPPAGAAPTGRRPAPGPCSRSLTRRYYRSRTCRTCARLLAGRSARRPPTTTCGARGCTCSPDGAGRDLAAALGEVRRLRAPTSPTRDGARARPLPAWPRPPADADELAARLRGAVAALALPAAMRRVTRHRGARRTGEVDTFTFRRRRRRPGRGRGSSAACTR